MDFFFHHSSLLTQFLSLIMHHLKYPNSLHPTHLDTVFSFHHSNISTFLWDLYLITKSNLSSVGPTLLKTTKHKAKNKLETTPPKKLKEKISLPLSLSLSLSLSLGFMVQYNQNNSNNNIHSHSGEKEKGKKEQRHWWKRKNDQTMYITPTSACRSGPIHPMPKMVTLP